jgi:hypothetical protein
MQVISRGELGWWCTPVYSTCDVCRNRVNPDGRHWQDADVTLIEWLCRTREIRNVPIVGESMKVLLTPLTVIAVLACLLGVLFAEHGCMAAHSAEQIRPMPEAGVPHGEQRLWASDAQAAHSSSTENRPAAQMPSQAEVSEARWFLAIVTAVALACAVWMVLRWLSRRNIGYRPAGQQEPR